MHRVILAAALLAACGPRESEPIRATMRVGELLAGDDSGYARVLEPRPFEFPADHGAHPEFRSEWWYFTGNVTTADGSEFGYQITFFRNALAPQRAQLDTDATSAWRAHDAYMAHFALTDIDGERFHAFEQFARAAAGLAGASLAPWRVWVGAWQLESVATETFPIRLRASDGDIGIDFTLEQGEAVVLNGERGVSRKGAEPGNASHYYSLMRMPTTGTVRVGGDRYTVSGDSWLDREWGTSALGEGIEGWDWFALQLDDDSELMIYRLRRRDGSADAFSGGTFVDSNGVALSLGAEDIRVAPQRTWRSALDDTAYPVAWTIVVPALDLMLDTTPAIEQQELNLSVRYWEGAIRARGTRAGRAVAGRGYLEITGYGAASAGGLPGRAAGTR